MNKSNKRWLIGGSIALIVIIGASIGIGAGIGAAIRKDDDYIKFYVNDTEFTLNEDNLNLGSEANTDSEKATMLSNQFMMAALFGTTDFDQIDVDNQYNSILINDNVNWNTPYLLASDDYTNTELLNTFMITKFVSDTQNSSVASYLLSLASTSSNPNDTQKALLQLKADADDAGIPWPAVTGLDIINNSAFANSKALIYEALINDINYVNEVLSDVMVYTYLWQDAPQTAYDYYFTKELVYASPSLTSKVVLDGSILEASYPDEYQKVEDITTDSSKIDALHWNDWISSVDNPGGTNVDDSALVDSGVTDDYIIKDGFWGFQGVTYGTEAGTNVASDWTDLENTWYFEDSEGAFSSNDEGQTINNNSNYNGDNISTYSNEDVLNNSNLYVAGEADGEGAAIYDTTPDETDPTPGPDTDQISIYSYTQLYPYAFKDKDASIDSEDYVELDSAVYSLFAENNGTYLTNASMNDAMDGNENVEYIFERWFGEDELAGEIYVAEAVMNYDSSLETNAFDYWYDEGFYMELSGTYETDLSSYIPTYFIKDNED